MKPLAAVLGAGLLAALVVLSACGGGDDDATGGAAAPLDRLQQIGGVAELAADAWAAAGPDGLYDYLDASVTAHCTKQQLEAALKDQELPTGFQGMESVRFEGAQAHATLDLIFHNDHRKIEWVFTPAGAGSWRLVSVPGLEKCGAS